jgi:hypothetical protein
LLGTGVDSERQWNYRRVADSYGDHWKGAGDLRG